MVQTLSKSSEPQVINAEEERTLAEWQQLYPACHLVSAIAVPLF